MSDSYRITQTTSSISSIADRNSFQENGQPVRSSPENNGQQTDFQEIQHASGERQLKLKELSLRPHQFAEIQAARSAARQQTAGLIQRMQQGQVVSPSANEQQIATEILAREIASRSLATSMKEIADKILDCKNKKTIFCNTQDAAEAAVRQGVIQRAVEGENAEIVAGGNAEATRPRWLLEMETAMAEAIARRRAVQTAVEGGEAEARRGAEATRPSRILGTQSEVVEAAVAEGSRVV